MHRWDWIIWGNDDLAIVELTENALIVMSLKNVFGFNNSFRHWIRSFSSKTVTGKTLRGDKGTTPDRMASKVDSGC